MPLRSEPAPLCRRPCACTRHWRLPGPGAVALALATALLAAGLPARADALEEVPYVQTPQPVVDAILDLAGTGPGDRLVDLGSGDGRIVITAARRFGTPGLGVEIDPSLVTLAQERAAEAGVTGLARFVAQDLFDPALDAELAAASVLTLYLLPDVNLALRPRLLEALAPGSRIVSHDWNMGDWRPQRSITVPAPHKPVGLRQESTLHLWVVPARVAGAWTLDIAGPEARSLPIVLRQCFQDLGVAVAGPGTGSAVEAPATGGRGSAGPGAQEDGRADAGRGSLRGRAISFTLAVDGQRLRFEGREHEGAMTGSVVVDGRARNWEARRSGPGSSGESCPAEPRSGAAAAVPERAAD